MQITISPDLQELLQAKVASGQYDSVDEVICEALDLLQLRDRCQQASIKQLRDAIKLGLDQLSQGEGIPRELVLAELQRKSAQRKQQSP